MQSFFNFVSASGDMRILTLFGMSVGTAVTIIGYISRIFAPIESLGMEIQTIQSAMAGVKRIDAFLAQPERDIPAPRSEKMSPRGDVVHARAVLGLPVPGVRFYGPSASRAIVVEGDTDKVVFGNLDEVLSEEGVQMRIFGKPEVVGHRRLGVILATADTVEEARAKADRAYKKLKVKLLPR